VAIAAVGDSRLPKNYFAHEKAGVKIGSCGSLAVDCPAITIFEVVRTLLNWSSQNSSSSK
jgi:hypothetical protein